MSKLYREQFKYCIMSLVGFVELLALRLRGGAFGLVWCEVDPPFRAKRAGVGTMGRFLAPRNVAHMPIAASSC